MIEKPTFSTTNEIILLDLAQKSYKGKDPRKLKDTIDAFAISEFEKYNLYEKVILIDRGRPPKSNPFKKNL